MFDTLSEKFETAFKHLRGKGKITEANVEEALKEVKMALLEADVNFKVVKNFIATVKDKALGEKVISGVNPDEQFIKIVHDELAHVMGNENEKMDLSRELTPIMVVGLNGAGKTTFCGKLSKYLTDKESKNVLLVPADTFRPAAKDQLITLAKSLNIDYFDSDLSLGPEAIAKAGYQEAKRLGKSVVIIDTAGRLHVDDDLMAEIVRVKEGLKNYKPEILMVADAMTGQEAVNVAQSFHKALDLTGVVLSKMDSDARGGAALSIRFVTGVPIRFISLGEKMKDLELFHPDRLAGRILDMGDVVSLVEKAEEIVDEKENEKLMKNLEKGKFTVNDFMKQMDMINKLGSMESILKMIPGMGGMMRKIGDISPAEDEMKSMKVIINSMTKQERNDYKILDGSRKKRIAMGSGKTAQQVNQFVEKFRQMEQMMTSMFGMMKGGGMPDLFGGGAMPGMGGAAGFRQPKGGKKKKKKGKRKGPFGGGYF